MKKNPFVKLALFEKDMTQAELARQTGINETTICAGIRGRINFRPDEMKKIAKVIGKPVSDLFPAE